MRKRRNPFPHPREGQEVQTSWGGKFTLKSPHWSKEPDEYTNGELEYARLVLIHSMSQIAESDHSKFYRDELYDQIAPQYREIKAEIERRRKELRSNPRKTVRRKPRFSGRYR